jgi:3-oxoacyl-[acyl-carrier-protein] synthase-3
MTALSAVSSYLPSSRVPVGENLREFGFTASQARMHERFYGFNEVLIDPDGGLTDQLVATISGMAELRSRAHLVRYVLHARTMPVVAPYPRNPLLEACRKVGLDDAVMFSVSQHACASALLAVDLAGKLLAADGEPGALALVVTSDKAFTASARALVAAGGVMSEGTAAVLVSADGDRDRMLGYATRTHGRFADGPWMGPDDLAAFQDSYATSLAEVIRAAVGKAGLTLADIALALPHNVNRMSWMRVLRALGVRRTDWLYLRHQAAVGHCFCADSFMNYRTAREEGLLRPGDRYVMTAVGLGATFSAMVFEH